MLLRRSISRFSPLIMAVSLIALTRSTPANAQTRKTDSSVDPAIMSQYEAIRAQYDKLDDMSNHDKIQEGIFAISETLNDKNEDKLNKQQPSAATIGKPDHHYTAQESKAASDHLLSMAKKNDSDFQRLGIHFSKCRTDIDDFMLVDADTAMAKVTGFATISKKGGAKHPVLSQLRDTWVKRHGQWVLQVREDHNVNLPRGSKPIPGDGRR